MKARGTVGMGEGAAVLWKWDWHYHTLLRLRDSLVQERDEHRAALRAVRDDSTRDSADVAEDEIEHVVLLAGLAAEEQELAEVEAALARIDAGTYGRCEATGKPIPAARLRAVPWTRFAAGLAAHSAHLVPAGTSHP